MPIAEAFERDGEEAFRAREAEVVGDAAGAGRRRRDRARRRQRLSRADPRGARPPHRRLAAGRRRGGLAPDRPQRPAAGHAAPRTSSALLAVRLPLYEELADAVVPLGRPGDRRAAPCPAIRALAELPAGDEAALGDERLRRVPGLRRPRACSSCGLVAAGRAGRFCVADTTVGAALRRAPRAARGAASRSSPARARRRWPRPSGCCASWPAPG